MILREYDMSNFDKQVKQLGESFSLEPRKEVWQRVEAELDGEKQRRGGFWWWTIPLLLLLGAGISYVALRPVIKADKAAIVTNTGDKTNPLQPAGNTTITIKQDGASTGQTIAPPAINKGNAEAARQPNEAVANPTTASNAKQDEPTQTAAHSTIHSSRSNQQTVKPTRPGNSVAIATTQKNNKQTTPTVTATPSSPNTSVNTVSNAAPPAALDAGIAKATLPAATLQAGSTEPETILQEPQLSEAEAALQAGTDSLAAAPDESITTTNTVGKTADSAVVSTSVIKEVKEDTAVAIATKSPSLVANPKKKGQWKLLLETGIANNKPYDFNLFATKKESLVYASPDLTAGGNNANLLLSNPELANRSAINLAAGVQRQQWLNSRFQWRAAAFVQYQQVKQQAGVKLDSAVNVNTYARYNASNSYLAGSSTSYKGENLRIFLSNDIVFKIFKKTPLLASAGIYGGVNTYSSFLVADYYSRRFVESKELYKTWFLGLNIGLEYQFKNRYQVGITSRNDLTPSQQSPGASEKQYWRSVNLSIGIPLSK